jgi:hypothetical protein
MPNEIHYPNPVAPPPVGETGVVVQPTSHSEAKYAKDRMVKKMLYYGYQMGYDQPRSRAEAQMEKQRLCFNHVEAWCKSDKCSIRKTLRGYSVEQLTKVLSQFEQVYKSFVKQYNQAG